MNVRTSTGEPDIRRRDRDASYGALVDAAMRSFHARGFAATRVEDIAQAAGYTRGAFYHHFENKTDCFAHVIEYRGRLRGDWPLHVLAGVTPTTASLEFILARTFAHFAVAEDGLAAWVLVMVDFHQQHRGDPAARKLLATAYAGWHAEIAGFLTALQDGGWIAPNRDIDLLTSQVFAFAEGLSIHASLYRDGRGGLIDGIIRLLS